MHAPHQSPRQARVGSVVGRDASVKHVEEVLGIGHPLVWGSGLASSALVVGQGGECWDLAYQPDNLLILDLCKPKTNKRRGINLLHCAAQLNICDETMNPTSRDL